MIRHCRKYAVHTLLLSLSFVPVSSFADIYYSGINFSYTNTQVQSSKNSTSQKESPVLAQIQGGYFFSDYIGAEIRYGSSVINDSNVSIEHVASAFLKGNLPVTDQISMYALAGYSDITAKRSSNEVSDTGVSVGIGLHYAFDSHKATTVEFIRYTDEDKVKLSGLQIGFQYRF